MSGRRPVGYGPSGSSAPGKLRKEVGFGICRGERKADASRGLDDTGGDFQETKTQRRELAVANSRALGMASRTVSINQKAAACRTRRT